MLQNLSACRIVLGCNGDREYSHGIHSLSRYTPPFNSSRYIYPAFLPPVLFPITGRRAELHDRTGSGQVARTGRLKSVCRRRRSNILQLSKLTWVVPVLVAVGRHQRTGARTIAYDLQQIRAARELPRTYRNLPHVCILRVNVPLTDLSTSPSFTLIILTSGLRFVAGFHVDPEIAQFKVLLIHLEIRVVLETPIHLDSVRSHVISFATARHVLTLCK